MNTCLLTGHLHVCPPVYNCSHPVPHDTLVQASISPLQRRDRQPKGGRDTQMACCLWSVTYMYIYMYIYIYIWAINKHYHSFCWMLTNISLDWSNVFSLWFFLPTCNPAKWLISHQQMKPKHIMHNINSNRINSNSLWVKHIIQNDTIRRKRCTSLVLSHDTCHGENQK